MASRYVIDVEENQFQQEVLIRSKQLPVVVDFWAPWCGPCRTLGPLLEAEVEALQGSVLLAKVNVDHAQRLAQAFRISGIPAVKAFSDGKVVAEFTGAQPKAKIQAFLNGLLPLDVAAEEEETQSVANAAREKFLQEAEAIGAPEALLDLRQKDPKDLGANYGLALHAAARGQDREALEMLLELVRRDRKWNDEAARRSMIDLFNAIGSRSELSEEFRDRLAMILF